MPEFLDRYTDRAVERERNRDRAGVDSAGKRMLRRFAMSFPVLVAYPWLSDVESWWAHILSVLAMVAIGCCVGAWSGIPLGRATAYRTGVQDARMEMWSSMSEAVKRGIEFPDWVQGEWEKDAVRLGLPPDTKP